MKIPITLLDRISPRNTHNTVIRILFIKSKLDENAKENPMKETWLWMKGTRDPIIDNGCSRTNSNDKHRIIPYQ